MQIHGSIQPVSVCAPNHPYLTFSFFITSCASRLGPASYDLGTSKYEENIIVDCFGRERLEEYRGKHKLDVW